MSEGADIDVHASPVLSAGDAVPPGEHEDGVRGDVAAASLLLQSGESTPG